MARNWLDDLTLQTVIVHTTDNGPSIKGLKAAVYDDCIVLRDAMVLDPEAQEILNGLVVIPRENVALMQLISDNGAG